MADGSRMEGMGGGRLGLGGSGRSEASMIAEEHASTGPPTSPRVDTCSRGGDTNPCPPCTLGPSPPPPAAAASSSSWRQAVALSLERCRLSVSGVTSWPVLPPGRRRTGLRDRGCGADCVSWRGLLPEEMLMVSVAVMGAEALPSSSGGAVRRKAASRSWLSSRECCCWSCWLPPNDSSTAATTDDGTYPSAPGPLRPTRTRAPD